jgi:hypothetical protein
MRFEALYGISFYFYRNWTELPFIKDNIMIYQLSFNLFNIVSVAQDRLFTREGLRTKVLNIIKDL